VSDPVLFVAAGFGLAYASAPGAVNAETLRRGVAHGFRPAFLVQAGSLLGDVGWAVLALAGLGVLLRDASLRALLGLVGGVLLAWFAITALAAARRPEPVAALPARTGAGSLATGIALSVANPFGPIFWLGVGGGLTGSGALDASPGGAVAFIASFAAGATCWAVGVSALLGYGRRWLRPMMFRVVDLACGIAFGWLALNLVITSLAILRR